MASEALPETYKAAVYDAPGKISTKVVDKPIPEPAAGDVLIRLYVLQPQQVCPDWSQKPKVLITRHLPQHTLRSMSLRSGYHAELVEAAPRTHGGRPGKQARWSPARRERVEGMRGNRWSRRKIEGSIRTKPGNLDRKPLLSAPQKK